MQLKDGICRKLKDCIRSAVWDEVCDTVLLSGGLDSSIITAIRKPEYSITIGFGSEVSDLKYADAAALKYVRKRIVKILSTQEVLGLIDKVIIALKTFDPITIRNSVVPYAALEVANSNGIKCVYTGDGGDEIFGGYNFLTRFKDNPSRLESEISRLRTIMTFPTFSLGETLNVKIISPFLNGKVVGIAELIPISDLVAFYRNRVWGKMVLRRCYRNELGEEICWRTKQAQEEGAGITKIREILGNNYTDLSFAEEARIAKSKGVVIRSKEHLSYFRSFIRNFSLEVRCDCPELTCSGCGNCVSFLSNYCQLCGQFPVK
ncbi:MAG: asparagine synthase-related protein [Nitrososphaeraceae archaeon]|nr:asparagine synthase-related protein [Nitrososphaeraceae archaeon]